MIPRASDGEGFTETDFSDWRRLVFTPGLAAAGLDRARPYDLRHSFASLLLHEGRSVIYVARQLGHTPAMTLGVYGHTIDELEDQPAVSAEDAIRAHVRSKFAPRSRSGPLNTENLKFAGISAVWTVTR